jgi:2'-5' RNA ligase
MFDNELRFVPEMLPGGRRANDYLLFVAALPPADIVRSASMTAQMLRATHRITKASMPDDRLHVTVQPVCVFPATWPGHKLSQVLEIATELTPTFSPFPMRLDRAGSMGRHAPTALALKGDAASRRALAELTCPLAKALQSYGFDEFEHAGRLPHMTLVYGTQWIADQAIEPIGWTVDRLMLLVSHRGCGHYQRVGAWPLRGAVEAELF